MENQTNKTMAIEVAQINELKVLRKTDIGFILVDPNDEESEVFLHNNETDNKDINVDDMVSVFIYIDHKKREAATLKTPLLTKDEYGLLEVVDVLPKLGVFLNLGIGKDVLLSVKELPLNFNHWPQKGDMMYVQLTYFTQMLAKLIDIDTYINPHTENLIKTSQDGYVVKVVNSGSFVILEKTKDLVFIKRVEMRDRVRLGELLNLTITFKTKLGYQATLIKQKEDMIDFDAEMILEYLKRNEGTMPFTADTDSETIMRSFKLSRKAFKRALGSLYRNRLIYFENNQTYINEENDKNKEED